MLRGSLRLILRPGPAAGIVPEINCMKLLKWVRFTWNLTQLSSSNLPLPAHYQIAPATPEDERELRKVYSSSFLLDPIWNPVIGEVMHSIQSRLDNIFPSANSTSSVNSTCLALRHGARIIGAAVLSLEADAEDHLAPGPCILTEYRNRGSGRSLPTSPVNSPSKSNKTCSLFLCASALAPVESSGANVIMAVWLCSLVCKTSNHSFALLIFVTSITRF